MAGEVYLPLFVQLLDSLKSVGSSACEIRDVKLHASADCFCEPRIHPCSCFASFLTFLRPQIPRKVESTPASRTTTLISSPSSTSPSPTSHLSRYAHPHRSLPTTFLTAHLQMETAHLFHLARISRMKGNISAAAAHMIFASRTMEAGGVSFIDPAVVSRLEPLVGRACLDAVIAFDIPSEVRSLWLSGTRKLADAALGAEIASRGRICLGYVSARSGMYETRTL